MVIQLPNHRFRSISWKWERNFHSGDAAFGLLFSLNARDLARLTDERGWFAAYVYRTRSLIDMECGSPVRVMRWWRFWPETAIFLRGLRPMFTGKFSPTNSSYSLRLCNVLRFESRLKVISFITEYVIFFYSVYRILPIRRCQLPFSKPPPLQPIRKVVQAWNLSCRVLGWVN